MFPFPTVFNRTVTHDMWHSFERAMKWEIDDINIPYVVFDKFESDEREFTLKS